MEGRVGAQNFAVPRTSRTRHTSRPVPSSKCRQRRTRNFSSPSSRFGDVEPHGEVVLVDPADVKVQVRGRDAWEREVHDVAVDQVPARHLLVGETFNIAGGWSSFPPHKHDGADGEPELEEAYTFRFDPPEGFGFQAVERPAIRKPSSCATATPSGSRAGTTRSVQHLAIASITAGCSRARSGGSRWSKTLATPGSTISRSRRRVQSTPIPRHPPGDSS